jgi:hypothetical protein
VAILKRENRLTSVRLCMDRSETASRAEVLFEVQRHGERVDGRRVDPEQMGIPLNFEAARAHRDREPSIRVPPDVLQWLDATVRSVLPDGEPLWLELASPHGNLPLVPWERLLQRRLRVPFLRVPYYTMPPVAASGSLDIALCVSSPVAKSPILVDAMLSDLVDQLLEAVPRPTVVHVFADLALHDALESMFRDRIASGTGSGVRLHDPRGAPRLDDEREHGSREPEREYRSSRAPEAAADVDNVWLRWMLETLATVTVDAVHFFCHGYLSVEQGALAVAESPVENRDERSARFVGTRQLVAFLMRSGASAASFTSPPRNHSVLGMRLLQHQVAVARPGAVLLHDLALDRRCSALTRSLALLYSNVPTPPPASPAISLYCHPRLVGLASEESSVTAARATEEYTVARPATSPLITGEDAAPAWLVSSQRYMEQSAAQLLEDVTQFPDDSSRRRGTGRALKFVSDVLQRHAIAGAREELNAVRRTRESLAADPGVSPNALTELDTRIEVLRRQTGAAGAEEASQ